MGSGRGWLKIKIINKYNYPHPPTFCYGKSIIMALSNFDNFIIINVHTIIRDFARKRIQDSNLIDKLFIEKYEYNVSAHY